jgi:site-specific recombinase XerD
MDTASKMTKKTGDNQAVQALIHRLVKDSPTLSDLSQKQLESIAKAVIIDDLKAEMSKVVMLAKIPYEDLKTEYLRRAEKRSINTRKAYKKAIDALEAFCSRRGIKVLEMKCRDADAFICSLEGSASTVRLRVAGCSAFFTYLDRETDGRVSNPFRGSKQRPRKDSATPNVPSQDDLNKILPRLKPEMQAAVICMLENGFRVGALPTLTIRGGRFTGVSKGKKIDGILSEEAIKAIKEAGLDIHKPFEKMTNDSIRNAFRYMTQRMKKEGLIDEAYSVHDLRHFFAIREYEKNKDIYRLKEVLGHASIGVTESYLKGIQTYLVKKDCSNERM